MAARRVLVWLAFLALQSAWLAAALYRLEADLEYLSVQPGPGEADAGEGLGAVEIESKNVSGGLMVWPPGYPPEPNCVICPNGHLKPNVKAGTFQGKPYSCEDAQAWTQDHLDEYDEKFSCEYLRSRWQPLCCEKDVGHDVEHHEEHHDVEQHEKHHEEQHEFENHEEHHDGEYHDVERHEEHHDAETTSPSTTTAMTTLPTAVITVAGCPSRFRGQVPLQCTPTRDQNTMSVKCCQSETPVAPRWSYGCEKKTYAASVATCEALGMQLCLNAHDDSCAANPECVEDQRVWTRLPCSLVTDEELP